MATIQAVLWDVDGTLISTKALYLECYRRALAPYIGKHMTDDELLALRPRSEFQLLRSQAGDHYDACLADFQQHYAELHTTHFGGIYDGVADVLESLRNRGLRTGLVTGKSRSSWAVTVAQIELGDFDVVILDDDVDRPKPDPQGILAALHRLGIAGEHAVYVGDTRSDLEAARAAGVTPIAAAWAHPPELLPRVEEAAAAFRAAIAHMPAQILEIIG